MKIYLDFDDTIFDTFTFVEELIAVWMRAGFTEEDFDRAYRETQARAGDFDMETLIKVFAETRSFDEVQTRRRIEKLLASADAFVYPDFFTFAQLFAKEDLKMLSFGTTDFQRDKIENAAVVPFFGELVITSESKEIAFAEIVKEHSREKIFFVEDKADQVDKVKELFPAVVTFKIERSNGRHRKTHSARTDFRVKNLNEVAELLKSKF